MSRHGRHGRYPHPHPVARPAARSGGAPDRAGSPAELRAPARRDPAPGLPAGEVVTREPVEPVAPAAHAVPVAAESSPASEVVASDRHLAVASGSLAERAPVDPPRTDPARPFPPPAAFGGDGPTGPASPMATCTTAQLRRFIKSRPWVPMHELRRRFGIVGDDDDVTPIRVGDQRLFIGLPQAEGRMVGDLLGGGDVGYELSLDPGAPVVVGLYPMRPVPRS